MPTLYFHTTRYTRSPQHFAHAPDWLIRRMNVWSEAIIESIVAHHGSSEILRRLSDPLWFQIFGSVLGMDWHSSGITTTVMSVLKHKVNKRFNELGIYVCGGKGKYSRQTPDELRALADRTGLNGDDLIRSSRLSAKVDNTAIHDGFQIYMHSFIVTRTGEWAVVQQGMNEHTGMARRYHWHSTHLNSFIENPHTGVYGQDQGAILNLTDPAAAETRSLILAIMKVAPARILPEIQKVEMSTGNEFSPRELNLKGISHAFAASHENGIPDFESLLLLEGIGPKTIYILALASHAIHRTSMQFADPARFPFVHDKDRNQQDAAFLKRQGEAITDIRRLFELSKIESEDKLTAVKNLNQIEDNLEKGFERAREIHKQRNNGIDDVRDSSFSNGSQLGLFTNS